MTTKTNGSHPHIESHAMRADPDVLIIGAGFSGIGVASSLDRAGLHDYLIVEQGDGFGGTWYWNRYPGIAVDIPSFSYQYSYAKRTSWSRVYAPGAELREYAEDCARRFGLHDKARFGTKITSATFDEARHRWVLETDKGDTIDARHVIDATGVLTQPKLPEIEGVDSFAGVTLHTARWDHSENLGGKRVAVIGTGASAVQLIPAIAQSVEHLTVFQRTPIWCLPKLDGPIPSSVKWLMGRDPRRSIRGEARQPVGRRADLPARRALSRHAQARDDLRGDGAQVRPRPGRGPGAPGEADAALRARLQAAGVPQHVSRDLQPEQRDA